jgi:hypothetical protein
MTAISRGGEQGNAIAGVALQATRKVELQEHLPDNGR